MTYLNGNDLPEHANRVVREVVTTGEIAHVTVREGAAVLISKEKYDQLMQDAAGEYDHSTWMTRSMDPNLEALFREEVDF